MFVCSQLGFFVAFLSWFAFSPLTPETVKNDLHLTSAQVSNSNIVNLSATLLIRLIVGPLVDHFGPRKVMASLLVLGAIPSGLAGTAHNAGSLYVVRFFVGILGGTFVPCQAWTSAWYDKSVVGAANALSGGWGNLGGGVTFATQTGLFQRLLKDGLSAHVAWRICFVVVPVPLLLSVAAGMLFLAQDHPLGKWSLRHQVPEVATSVIVGSGSDAGPCPSKCGVLVSPERSTVLKSPVNLAITYAKDDQALSGPHQSDPEKGAASTDLHPEQALTHYVSPVDVAVNEPFTLQLLGKVVLDRRTWMLALAYASTFGFELAMDSSLANSLFELYKGPNFKQLDAGYLACTYGLLNICFRFLGGASSDILYRRFGVRAKKWLLLSCAVLQGLMALGLGLLIDYGYHSKGNVMGLVVLCALFGFMANGANYALVPHISSRSNGLMSGIVGGIGNAGGIFYSLIWRFQSSSSAGRPFWISGVVCTGLNLLLMFVPLGDAN